MTKSEEIKVIGNIVLCRLRNYLYEYYPEISNAANKNENTWVFDFPEDEYEKLLESYLDLLAKPLEVNELKTWKTKFPVQLRLFDISNYPETEFIIRFDGVLIPTEGLPREEIRAMLLKDGWII